MELPCLSFPLLSQNCHLWLIGETFALSSAEMPPVSDLTSCFDRLPFCQTHKHIVILRPTALIEITISLPRSIHPSFLLPSMYMYWNIVPVYADPNAFGTMRSTTLIVAIAAIVGSADAYLKCPAGAKYGDTCCDTYFGRTCDHGGKCWKFVSCPISLT